MLGQGMVQASLVEESNLPERAYETRCVTRRDQRHECPESNRG